MVNTAEVRALALTLPRTEEAFVRDRRKFRIGRIVYLAFSRDEREMGFGFPREERAALVAAEPDTFFLPRPADLRYRWVECWPERLDPARMRELVVDAWAMCVPKRVARDYFAALEQGDA
jgi:hypothetical protein